jgi:hypothetical protein
MAILYDGPVLPDDLTTFVRNVPPLQNIALNQWLPDRHLPVNRVDVGILTKVGRTARFRVFDGPIHVARRDSAVVSQVNLPPLSDQLAMGELERLQIEFARTGGTNTSAFVNAIYNDAEILTRNVQRRMELARGDVLTDGKFTLAGEGGLVMEADYAVPGGNFTTASILWGHTATGVYDADILGDLNTVVTNYINLNGFPPGGMIINRTIMNNILFNDQLRKATGSILGANTMLTRPQVDAVLDAHVLPPILGVYDSSFDVDGVSTRALPVNKVIFVPPAGQTLGYTAWGVTATALELVNSNEADMTFSNAPGIVGVVEKDGPPYRQFTFVDAVGMPVIENPYLLAVLTVN